VTERCVVCGRFVGKKGVSFWSAEPEKKVCPRCAEVLQAILRTEGIKGLYDFFLRKKYGRR